MTSLSGLKLEDCNSIFPYENGRFSREPRKVGFQWDDVAQKVTAIFFAQEGDKWVAFATLDEKKITVETVSQSRMWAIVREQAAGDDVSVPPNRCMGDISPTKKTFFLETVGDLGGREVMMEVLPPEKEEDKYERYVTLTITDPR